jgi:hypothetical protein
MDGRGWLSEDGEAGGGPAGPGGSHAAAPTSRNLARLGFVPGQRFAGSTPWIGMRRGRGGGLRREESPEPAGIRPATEATAKGIMRVWCGWEWDGMGNDEEGGRRCRRQAASSTGPARVWRTGQSATSAAAESSGEAQPRPFRRSRVVLDAQPAGRL